MDFLFFCVQAKDIVRNLRVLVKVLPAVAEVNVAAGNAAFNTSHLVATYLSRIIPGCFMARPIQVAFSSFLSDLWQVRKKPFFSLLFRLESFCCSTWSHQRPQTRNFFLRYCLGIPFEFLAVVFVSKSVFGLCAAHADVARKLPRGQHAIRAEHRHDSPA